MARSTTAALTTIKTIKAVMISTTTVLTTMVATTRRNRSRPLYR
jgi:hypothetical protein